MHTLLIIISLLCYGLATVILLRNFRQQTAKKYSVLFAMVASLTHLWILATGSLLSTQGLDVSIFTILSLVSWLVATLFILASLRQPVECLGIVIFPFVMSMILLREFTPQHVYLSDLSVGLELHIVLSILAYSALSIAAIQGLLLYLQDTQLHNHHPKGFIRALPSLETMETLLFKMIGAGFVLLTLSLLSGIPYLQDMVKQHLAHKTILSSIAWVVFAILLWGRWQHGWRGRLALRWIFTGFILLMLAYFGSKVVLELILKT